MVDSRFDSYSLIDSCSRNTRGLNFWCGKVFEGGQVTFLIHFENVILVRLNTSHPQVEKYKLKNLKRGLEPLFDTSALNHLAIRSCHQIETILKGKKWNLNHLAQ